MFGFSRLRHRSTVFTPLIAFIFFCWAFLSIWVIAGAQDIPPELLEEAARRSGLSKEEVKALYQQQQESSTEQVVDQLNEPGRTSLEDVDDRQPPRERVILPYETELLLLQARADSLARASEVDTLAALAQPTRIFGADFFRLDPGVFNPTTFGPVPDDYLIGVGDQIIVDVWGEVEFRLERIVDRDGSIILPRGGKVPCYNRTLAQLEQDLRSRLARSYSGLNGQPGEATTYLDVSLGALRAIRVFVVGDAVQPGAYELSSLATVFTALYAAGGPAETGSMRDIRLVRGNEVVGRLDVYRFLLEGKRDGDSILREGDTVFISPRGKTVELRGAVRRPLLFELREQEGLEEVIRFAGGFTAEAATRVVHVERILPPASRAPEQPDKVHLDIAVDPLTAQPLDPAESGLLDGDILSVDFIAQRLGNWIAVQGNVKQPGRYQYQPGMTVSDLVGQAGGLWPDTFEERAIVDRVKPDDTFESFDFPLGEVMSGAAAPLILEPRDVITIFSRWDLQDRAQVSITGAIRNPLTTEYREGMTLRDLVIKAGGLQESADLLRAEVSRLRGQDLESRDLSGRRVDTVDVLEVNLGADFLTAPESFPLMPHDQVAIRQLPWWELQQNVMLRGEFYYPGVYSLERPGETLSSLVQRAGGLKPTAFPDGARIVRAMDGVGNIALDLKKALSEPGSAHDIVLAAGDEVIVPEIQHTVKVIGAVGFPTSIVWQSGNSLGYYVERAGGYAKNADKWKTRVIYPNGMSRPIKRFWWDPKVVAGSTVEVPLKEAKEKSDTMGTIRDIFAIAASAATVYWIIDRTQ